MSTNFEDQVVQLVPMPQDDADLYTRAIQYLKLARPTLDKGREAIQVVAAIRGRYGVPTWKTWIVAALAGVTILMSIFVGLTLPVLTLQLRASGIGLALLLALPFLYRVNLTLNALVGHYVAMFATVLGIIVGGYYLYLIRSHGHISMFAALFCARVLYSMIPIWKVMKDKKAKDSFSMKLTTFIAVIGTAMRITAVLAALVEGFFPVISYGWMILGIEVVHIVWKEFGVKGSSTLASTASNYLSANASALLVISIILLLMK
jgi:hypothetical protein